MGRKGAYQIMWKGQSPFINCKFGLFKCKQILSFAFFDQNNDIDHIKSVANLYKNLFIIAEQNLKLNRNNNLKQENILLNLFD